MDAPLRIYFVAVKQETHCVQQLEFMKSKDICIFIDSVVFYDGEGGDAPLVKLIFLWKKRRLSSFFLKSRVFLCQNTCLEGILNFVITYLITNTQM